MADDYNVIDYIEADSVSNGASVASWARGTTPDVVLNSKDDDGMMLGAQSIVPPAPNVRGIAVVWRAVGLGPGSGSNTLELVADADWDVGARTDWVRGGAGNFAYGLITTSPRGAITAPRDRPSRFINPGEVGMAANWIGPASNQVTSMVQPVDDGLADEATATDWSGTVTWSALSIVATHSNMRVVYMAQLSADFSRADFDALATRHGVTADREPF